MTKINMSPDSKPAIAPAPAATPATGNPVTHDKDAKPTVTKPASEPSHG